jgi:hypothetical protein
MTECPDNWVIVNLKNGVKKVLCSWSGGYLGGDEWRLSSGVVHGVEFPDRFEISNVSGSLYVLYKNRQGCSAYMNQIINNWKEKFDPDEFNFSIITLPDPTIIIVSHAELLNEMPD